MKRLWIRMTYKKHKTAFCWITVCIGIALSSILAVIRPIELRSVLIIIAFGVLIGGSFIKGAIMGIIDRKRDGEKNSRLGDKG